MCRKLLFLKGKINRVSFVQKSLGVIQTSRISKPLIFQVKILLGQDRTNSGFNGCSGKWYHTLRSHILKQLSVYMDESFNTSQKFVLQCEQNYSMQQNARSQIKLFDNFYVRYSLNASWSSKSFQLACGIGRSTNFYPKQNSFSISNRVTPSQMEMISEISKDCHYRFSVD